VVLRPRFLKAMKKQGIFESENSPLISPLKFAHHQLRGDRGEEKERGVKGMGIASRLCWAAAINMILLESCLSWCPTSPFARGVGFPLGLRHQHHGRVQGVALGATPVRRRTRTNIASGARCSTVRDVATQEDLMNVVQFASQALPNRYSQGVCASPDIPTNNRPAPEFVSASFAHMIFTSCLLPGSGEARGRCTQDSDECVMLRTGPTER
jgi:hypothetical protein